MPCRRGRKTEHILQSEKKKKSKKKRKKIRTEIEKKRKETKKEKGELIQWACTNRSASLSPPSNLTFFPKRKQGLFLWGNNHSGPTPSKPLIPMAGSFLGGLFALRRGVLPSLALLRQTKFKT